MSDVRLDGGLANEMVELLARELKSVRSQLQAEKQRRSSIGSGFAPEGPAFVPGSESLKAESMHSQDHSGLPLIKTEDTMQYEESIHEMRSQLAEALQQQDILLQENQQLQGSKDQLSALRVKYKRVKAEKSECLQVVEDLRAELSQCTEELEKLSKPSVLESNFDAFFNRVPYIPVAQQPALASIPPHGVGLTWRIGKNIQSLRASPCYLDSREVVWSPVGIALGLVIKIPFQYNPKTNEGTWTNTPDFFQENQPSEVHFRVGKAWHYLGTYERLEGMIVLSPQLLEQVYPEKLKYASDRTTLFHDLVPPSQTRMIKNMYANGVLQLQCFAIRCIGFNSELSSELLKNAPKKDQEKWDNPVLPGCSRKEPSGILKRKMESENRPHKRKKVSKK